MLHISILINIGLFAICSIILHFMLKYKKDMKRLFYRSYRLELKLLKLYTISSEDRVRKEIDCVLNNLKLR